MCIIQGAGIESALPDVAAGMMDSIPVGGVSAVCVLQRPAKGVWLPWRDKEVNMVGHETVADKRQAVQLNTLANQIQINPAISLAVKYEPPSVATLRHMVR
jgi:hypothetical protein